MERLERSSTLITRGKASWRHDEFRGDVLKQFFLGKTFAEITPMLIAQYVNARLKSTTKRKQLRNSTTVYKEVALVSSVFNMAIREGVAQVNPLPLNPDGYQEKAAGAEQAGKVLD